jgi:hypothetical protein
VETISARTVRDVFNTAEQAGMEIRETRVLRGFRSDLDNSADVPADEKIQNIVSVEGFGEVDGQTIPLAIRFEEATDEVAVTDPKSMSVRKEARDRGLTEDRQILGFDASDGPSATGGATGPGPDIDGGSDFGGGMF